MLFIGPHVSISGSIALAVERAKELGATGFAIFSKNQRQWASPALKEEDINLFKENMKKCSYSPRSVLPHAGYLINPASPDPELREKSLKLFNDEADRITALGLDIINIHPGAYKEGDRRDGVLRSINMIDEVLEAHPGLRIAIENTAGAGTIIGCRFEELLMLLENSKHKARVGFTLDTAHLFGAGYDVKSDINKVLDEFFSLVGKDKLFGMHLNDSKVPLASNKDRHDNLGKGLIGLDPFKELVRRAEVKELPLILETPDETLWKDEIKELLDAAEG